MADAQGKDDVSLMCGIAGVIGVNGRSASDAVTSRLIESMGHRGPDGAVRHDDQGIAMAHVRLSILDPSPAGAQPMSRFGSHIIHNGEIFNYHELAQELSAEGFTFSTGTDTKVIFRSIPPLGRSGGRSNKLRLLALRPRAQVLIAMR